MLKDKKVIKRQWKKLYDENGAPYLEEVGAIDFNKEVCSHTKSVDLKEIIKRYQAGETDILNRVQGVYSDITDTPTDLIYLNETIQKQRHQSRQNMLNLMEKTSSHIAIIKQELCQVKQTKSCKQEKML